MNGNPTNQNAVDCNGKLTYQGEIFNSRQALQNRFDLNPNGFCGYPIGGYTPGGRPANVFNGTNGSIDPLGGELASLFPAPNAPQFGPQAFLSSPKRSETENKFDIRGDYTISPVSYTHLTLPTNREV